MLKLRTQDISALYLGETKIKRAYLGETLVFEGSKPSRLPEGYTEVEYIESSGTQYIDTGVKPSDSLIFYVDFYIGSLKYMTPCLFGCLLNQVHTTFNIGRSSKMPVLLQSLIMRIFSNLLKS